MALKVGVVGMGGIGNRHAGCHAEDDLADLVAVCDVVKESADRAAERHGVKAYYSLKDMLENEDLDIVDVTTGGNENGSWHYEPTMEALAAGRHVLCEKPLSNDIDEARDMVAYAAEQNLYLGCNLNHYFSQPADKAREYIAEGKVGEQIYCIHKMGFAGGEATYKPSKAPKTWGHPYFHVKAFLTHPFSVMRDFCGNITHVQAFFDRPSFRKQAGDLMISLNSIHVRFESGAMGYLLSQRGDATFGLGGWWSVEVAGTRGTFCIENCVEKSLSGPRPAQRLCRKICRTVPHPIPLSMIRGLLTLAPPFPIASTLFSRMSPMVCPGKNSALRVTMHSLPLNTHGRRLSPMKMAVCSSRPIPCLCSNEIR